MTPLLRMHSANFTAFARAAVLPAPPLLPAAVWAGALEPHALIRATIAIGASAASGRCRLLMVSPAGRDRVDIKALRPAHGLDELRGGLSRCGEEQPRLAALPLPHHPPDGGHPPPADGDRSEERQAPPSREVKPGLAGIGLSDQRVV